MTLHRMRSLFLVESMYFNETSDEKAAKKAKREKAKAKVKAKVVEAEKVRLRKRRTDDVCEDNHPSSPHLNQPLMAHTNMEPPSISTTILHAQFIAASLITSTVMLVMISLVTMRT